MNDRGTSELRHQFIEIIEKEKSPEQFQKLAEFASNLVDQVGGLEQAWLDRLEDLDFLFQASQRVFALENPEDLLQSLAEMICERIAVRRCSVMIMDETRSHLELKAAVGLKGDWSQIRVPVGKGMSGRVAATGTSLLIKNIEEDEDFLNPLKGKGRKLKGGGWRKLPGEAHCQRY